MCALLIESGANVNHESQTHDTALSLAVYQGQRRTAELLLLHRADLEHEDEVGVEDR